MLNALWGLKGLTRASCILFNTSQWYLDQYESVISCSTLAMLWSLIHCEPVILQSTHTMQWLFARHEPVSCTRAGDQLFNTSQRSLVQYEPAISCSTWANDILLNMSKAYLVRYEPVKYCSTWASHLLFEILFNMSQRYLVQNVLNCGGLCIVTSVTRRPCEKAVTAHLKNEHLHYFDFLQQYTSPRNANKHLYGVCLITWITCTMKRSINWPRSKSVTNNIYIYTTSLGHIDVQRQKAVSVYFTIKQVLPFWLFLSCL